MSSTFYSSKGRPSAIFGWVLVALFIAATIWSFTQQRPSPSDYQDQSPRAFSLQRAQQQVEAISRQPHYLGSAGHTEVRDYLLEQLQLLGLKPELFRAVGTHVRHQFSAASTDNIVAKIDGRVPGNAILLLSHYDSSLHSSLGASDAASGVAAILEGVRAYIAGREQPLNDIIILFSDGEERGLLGAQAFVQQHPWAEQVKMVLNFEARGSGGPSYMLMETNGGNAELVRHFSEAGLRYPAANSLMYSIYKLLPNDTDLTIFREQGDIAGYNFAFIDDHFDYHTVQDSADRLDPASLAHQGHYLMGLMKHFAEADLSSLDSDQDWVYFNLAGVGMVSYPFSWGLPLVFAALLFLLPLWHRARQQPGGMKLGSQAVTVGLSLLVAAAIGYGGWALLTWVWPAFTNSPHGFHYGGHWLIGLMVSLSLVATQLITQRFDGGHQPLLAILLWVLLNLAIAFYLPGAGFFILLPVALIGWCYLDNLSAATKVSTAVITLLQLLLLLLPLLLLAPLIPSFVIGLGLDTLFIATLLTVLLLILLLPPLLPLLPQRTTFWVACAVAVGCLLGALSQLAPTPERKYSNSISYLWQADEKQGYWFSGDRNLTPYVRQFLASPISGEEWPSGRLPNYRSAKVHWFEPTTEIKPSPGQIIERNEHSDGELRQLSWRIQPRPEAALVQVISEHPIDVAQLKVNGKSFDIDYPKPMTAGFLFTYTLSPYETELQLELSVDMTQPLSLRLLETSFDLNQRVRNKLPRTAIEMPQPFIINDAVIVAQPLK